MNERAETIKRITDMLCKIADPKLVNRIYRFTKYIIRAHTYFLSEF